MSEKPEESARPERRRRDEGRLARSAARLAAVQALYQMEMTGGDVAAVRREFETHRLGAEIEGAQYREADLALFRDLLDGAVRGQVRIDHLTDRALVERWPLGRIDSILRALFRAAGHELTARRDIPPRVVIGEYVDIAKAFFAGREPGLVNAVLDHMARVARPDEMRARGGPGSPMAEGSEK